jgi:hypothetical protein
MASGVESGIMTFVNHGCNGTYNTGMATNETELSIALGRGPQGILTYDALIRPYHARMARHFPSTPEDGVNFALVDLQPGTEVLDNYLVFGGIESIDYWDDNLRELQTVCSGGSGLISNYETATAQQ